MALNLAVAVALSKIQDGQEKSELRIAFKEIEREVQDDVEISKIKRDGWGGGLDFHIK